MVIDDARVGKEEIPFLNLKDNEVRRVNYRFSQVGNEGLFYGVVHSVNRHILFIPNRSPLSLSPENRNRPTSMTIIIITAISTVHYVNSVESYFSSQRHQDLKIEQIVFNSIKQPVNKTLRFGV